MKIYDWIVVGGGITGAAVSYELAKKGFAVLLCHIATKLDRVSSRCGGRCRGVHQEQPRGG